MKNTKIAEISAYLPERIVANEEIEQRINQKKNFVPSGILNKLFGIRERRFAAPNEQVSDLAAKAAQPIVAKIGKENIDFLIFAAASADLIEPATSNIVQQKLGLRCPVMDVKNACNSFVSAIQVATAFIQSGIYHNVLIVNGEKLSDAINFEIRDMAHLQRSLAAFSLGDAGTAALITASTAEEGFCYQNFMSLGEHWDLCTIQGGGSMFPHDVSKNYFEGKTTELKDVILQTANEFVNQCLYQKGWAAPEIDHFITHQVSAQTFKIIAAATGIEESKMVSVFEQFGNTAAAAIPLSLHCANSRNLLKKGDKIAVLGLAAGISVSVQLMVW